MNSIVSESSEDFIDHISANSKKRYAPSSEDSYIFMAAEYYATGEGRSVSLMVTDAYPSMIDYEDKDCKKQLITTREYRAIREFREKFDQFMTFGVEFYSEKDFINRYKLFLPPTLIDELQRKRGMIYYYSKFHLNLC
jgi:hypothetical protein